MHFDSKLMTLFSIFILLQKKKKKKVSDLIHTCIFLSLSSTQSESLLLINMLPKIRHTLVLTHICCDMIAHSHV